MSKYILDLQVEEKQSSIDLMDLMNLFPDITEEEAKDLYEVIVVGQVNINSKSNRVKDIVSRVESYALDWLFDTSDFTWTINKE